MAPIPSDSVESVTLGSILQRRDNTEPPKYDPGHGTFLPSHGQQKGWFALFALIGAAMVVATIWFFFWAKNGGFIWKKGDWEDYKSTVLRRKGKDGRTLTNATPRTNLGQKSIAGTFTAAPRSEMSEVKPYRPIPQTYKNNRGKPEKQHHSRPKREHPDPDVRAYRREKPARVGGLNREADGSNFDWTNSDRSELSSQITSAYGSEVHLQPKPASPSSPKKMGFMEKRREKAQAKKEEKAKIARAKARAKEAKQNGARLSRQPLTKPEERHSPQSRYSFTEVDDSTVADTADLGTRQRDSYYREYRRVANPGRTVRSVSPRQHSSRPSNGNAPRQSSPLKHSSHAGRYPGAFETYSDAGSSETGTKVYSHHIPELSRGAPSRGFRRGMHDRRDSLSGSDLD